MHQAEQQWLALAEQQRREGASYDDQLRRVNKELSELMEWVQHQEAEAALLRASQRCSELEVELAEAKGRLQSETWDRSYFESYVRRNKHMVDTLVARVESLEHRLPTDPVAILNQELANAGAFATGVGASLHQLHHETLSRMKNPNLEHGGAGTHLSPSSRALMVFTYNTSRKSCYRVHGALHKWAGIDYVSRLHRGVYAGLGAGSEYAESNALFYNSIGCVCASPPYICDRN